MERPAFLSVVLPRRGRVDVQGRGRPLRIEPKRLRPPDLRSSNVVSLDLNISVGDSAFHAQGEADVVMKALAEFKALVEAAPKTKRQVASSEEKQDGKDDGAGQQTQFPDLLFWWAGPAP